MTKLSIRTMLRRVIMEVTPQNWPDAVLDDLINVAYHSTQKEVMKVDPEAFLEWVRRDIVLNKSDYPKPEGSWWPNQVRLKNSTTGKYDRLVFKPFDEAETWTDGNVWSRRGNYIWIFPTPSANLTDGIEMIHVPTLTLAADTDIPVVPLGLHMAIVYVSKILALGETYQGVDKDRTLIADLMGDLSMYYWKTGGEGYTFQPDIIKPFGYQGS